MSDMESYSEFKGKEVQGRASPSPPPLIPNSLESPPAQARRSLLQPRPSGYVYPRPHKRIKRVAGGGFYFASSEFSDAKLGLLNMEEDTLIRVAKYLKYGDVYSLGRTSRKWHKVEIAFGRKVFKPDHPNTMYERLLLSPVKRSSLQFMERLQPQSFSALTSAANDTGRTFILASGEKARRWTHSRRTN